MNEVVEYFEETSNRQRVAITVLMDNVSTDAGLHSEHGLAMWVECGEHRILFDTGKSSLLLDNARTLGADPGTADAIVLSHGHYDHTGGLAEVLELANRATVYVHPAAIEPKYSTSNDKIHTVAMPDVSREALLRVADDGRVVWTEGPTQVCPGMWVTGSVSRGCSLEETGGQFYLDRECQRPDHLPDDQTCFLDSDKGLVVLLGCTHSGVINTLDYVRQLTGRDRVHAVIGGMHLGRASAERIAATIQTLERCEADIVVPAHCTGTEAMSKIAEAFGQRYTACSVGLEILVLRDAD